VDGLELTRIIYTRLRRPADTDLSYTTILNIAFLALAGVLVARFFTTGGSPMLKMMGGSPDASEAAP